MRSVFALIASWDNQDFEETNLQLFLNETTARDALAACIRENYNPDDAEQMEWAEEQVRDAYQQSLPVTWEDGSGDYRLRLSEVEVSHA